MPLNDLPRSITGAADLSLLARLFRTAPDRKDALRPLWHRTVELARAREYYADCGVADSVEGRFDMICAVLALVLVRMERVPELVEPSVRLTELFVDDMDGQLREFGIGDMVVGKHVGRLMASLGGRLGAYRDGLAGDDPALAAAADRNIRFGDDGDPHCIARHLRALAARLDATPDDALLQGEIA